MTAEIAFASVSDRVRATNLLLIFNVSHWCKNPCNNSLAFYRHKKFAFFSTRKAAAIRRNVLSFRYVSCDTSGKTLLCLHCSQSQIVLSS